MTLNQYLKQLMPEEREKLAREIERSPLYLRKLAATNLNSSIRIAKSVLESKFNRTLPSDLQYTEDDYLEHRKRINGIKKRG